MLFDSAFLFKASTGRWSFPALCCGYIGGELRTSRAGIIAFLVAMPNNWLKFFPDVMRAFVD